MKALLVLDMPNSCDDCELNRYYNDIHIHCDHPCNTAICGEIVPEWCPLKPLPQRYDEDAMREQKGWNRCLDEILGETNG